ncbi:MAG: hypothetical protein C0613_11550 [Desulfobulbaceae bacterium]|nr:MAG: hypothetical protein C0613_11550 [Desulfobulbaceae bacterium]
MAKKIDSPSHHNTKQQRFAGFIRLVVALMLVGLLILLVLPHGLKMALSHWLEEAGVGRASLEDVDFNPFVGRLVLKTVRLSNEQQVGLSAAEVQITFKWWPLRQRRLHIEDFQIRHGTLALHRLPDGTIRLAGLPLGSAEPVSGESANPPPSGSPWGLALDALTITDMRLSYEAPDQHEQYNLSRATFQNISTWQKNNPSPFTATITRKAATLQAAGTMRPFAAPASLQAELRLENFALELLAPFWGTEAPVSLQARANGTLALEATLDRDHETVHYASTDSLQMTDVAYQDADLQLQAAELSWQGSSRATLKATPGSLHLSLSGTLTTDAPRLQATPGPYGFAADRLALEGEVTVARSDSKETGMDYRAQGSIHGLVVRAHGSDRYLMRAHRLDVAALQGKDAVITVPETEVTNLQLLQGDREANGPDGPGPMLAFDKVTLQDLAVSQEGFITLERLHLADADGRLLRNQRGELEQVARHTEKSTDSPNADRPKPGGIRINKVSLTGKNRLVFVDHVPATPYRETFTRISLETGPMDSRRPEQQTPVTLESSIGDYGSLTLSGTIAPFAVPVSMDLQGQLSSLNLPTLNPYAEHYLSYHLTQGQLSADIVMQIEAGMLDSAVALVLEKLQLNKVDRGEDRFEKLTGLPFQYTVDLLRDSKDDIRIRLPISGDIRTPDFQLDHVISQALLSGVRKAAISYYAPIGISLLTGVTLPVGSLYVSGKLIDWATTLRFEPIIFERTSTTIAAESQPHLDRLVRLLSDRPKVRVVLCGIANPGDLATRQSASLPQQAAEAKTISAAEKEELRALAGNRALQVKEYLVAHGIEAQRLIVCDAQVDMHQQDKPRVEIVI